MRRTLSHPSGRRHPRQATRARRPGQQPLQVSARWALTQTRSATPTPVSPPHRHDVRPIGAKGRTSRLCAATHSHIASVRHRAPRATGARTQGTPPQGNPATPTLARTRPHRGARHATSRTQSAPTEMHRAVRSTPAREAVEIAPLYLCRWWCVGSGHRNRVSRVIGMDMLHDIGIAVLLHPEHVKTKARDHRSASRPVPVRSCPHLRSHSKLDQPAHGSLPP